MPENPPTNTNTNNIGSNNNNNVQATAASQQNRQSENNLAIVLVTIWSHIFFVNYSTNMMNFDNRKNKGYISFLDF